MLNKEFEIAGDKELADTKEWFFRENVRLAEEKERIFEERRKLEHEFRIKNMPDVHTCAKNIHCKIEDSAA